MLANMAVLADEERHLTVFFGKDYQFYKSYTKIGIPLIRSRDYPELLKPDWEEAMRQNGNGQAVQS